MKHLPFISNIFRCRRHPRPLAYVIIKQFNLIKDDRQSGIRGGVNGTPTFFINGKRYDGSPDYDSLLAALSSIGMTHETQYRSRPRVPENTG
jgi:DSBA-like thioredoxin domain